MIDLHTHSLLSDGELLPLELARRAKVKGYTILGISDHVDVTNLEHVATSILKLKEKIEYFEDIVIVPGVEITHSPARYIGEMVARARGLGHPLCCGSRRDYCGTGAGRYQPGRHRGKGGYSCPPRSH